jgi:hypothetical protein
MSSRRGESGSSSSACPAWKIGPGAADRRLSPPQVRAEVIRLACELPEHVGLTTRMRANAALHKLPPARREGQRGRTQLKGKRMKSLAEIAQAATFKPARLTGRDGKTRTALVHEFTCLWYKSFHTRPIKVILVRNPKTNKDFDIAIASTADAAQIIERYDGRWVIAAGPLHAAENGT